MRTLLLIIGAILPLYSSWVYAVSILKGETIPQRMTRFLMVVLTIVMTVSLWAAHDTSGIWLALVSFMQSVVLLGLSWKRGIGGTSWLDMACLLLCIAGVGVWILADQPLVGLAASILADAIAMVPSLLKTIHMPHTENMWFYALDTLAGLAVVAAGPYGWREVVFPLYIVLINAVFVLVIRCSRDAVPAKLEA